MEPNENNNAFRPEEQPAPTPEASSPRKKSRLWPKIVALALCCTVLGAALGVGGCYLKDYVIDRQRRTDTTMIYEGSRVPQTIDITKVDTGSLMTAAEIYAANVNSTVGITTSITTNFWGYQTTSAASGSGFILTADGYIVTNYHVISDSDSVTVSTYDGSRYPAEIIGYDANNDIAVLKIDAEGLSPVVLGSSDALNVGDDVVAIGNPLGELTFSQTGGMVSALDREVTMSNGITMDLIQTDCAINSGNSGGALFNMYGEVVGITNAKYSGSRSGSASIDNICFAIPIDNVRGIIESIIENGFISKPYIGVSVMNVSAEAQGYGLPEGASVQSVTEGSPAEKAGLQVSDIITAVSGTAITGSNDLVDYIRSCSVGDELTLDVYRQGETLQLTLIVGEQVQSALADTTSQSSQSQPSTDSGISGFPWNFFGF